jgi:hypothetical protein
MAREIGYFKYKSRSSIELYGSGLFTDNQDTGYVYGWENKLGQYKLTAHLKLFNTATSDAKAGMMLRTMGKSDSAFIGVFVGGDNNIKVIRRINRGDDLTVVSTTAIGRNDAVWLQIENLGGDLTIRYSLDLDNLGETAVTWTTLGTFPGLVSGWDNQYKFLSCSSGSDNVNLAYFTKVKTEECYISPNGQKEG